MTGRSNRGRLAAVLCLLVFATGAGQASAAPKEKEETAEASGPSDPGIVGGSVAPAGAYPFFVSIKRTSDNFAFCGGTLVSSVWVLTAAHCVDGGTTAASLKLVIGANQLNNEAPGDIRSVSAIHLHPSWNPSTFENDVAMLRLTTASTKAWARMAEPVDPVGAGQTVRTLGHGHTTQGGTNSNDLRQVDLPIQHDAKMSESAHYGSSFHGAVMIGAGPLGGGADSCQNDSGGPLFISGGQARLVGDTSWGSGCAQPDKPGIYGEVYQGAMRTFVNGLVSRPASDNFAGSSIGGPDGSVSGSNTDATGQTGEPNITGSTADTSVWYSWVAPESGRTSFSLRADFDTTLQVFTGGSFGTLATVASSDDFNGTSQSKVIFNATAGTVYRIAVDGFSAAHGPFTLQWAQNWPEHDNFAAPKTLTGATGKESSFNTRSTGEPGEPSHHGTVPDRTVWFTWTAPQTGTASFNTRESSFDTVIAAYTGTAIGSLTRKASNDEFNGAGQSKITFPVASGTTYRIAVDGFSGATGTIGLQWTIAAPANDSFATPTVLYAGPPYYGLKSGSTVRSTGEPAERDYHGGAAADNSVWYTWKPYHTAPARIRLRNLSAGYGPGIGVYTGGGLDSLTSVASGETEAAFNAVAGTTYRIAVDGNSGTTGTFQLEYVPGKCNALNATMFASGGTTTGTPGNDVIVGSTLGETINGGGGNDTICSLSGNDTLYGDANDDKLFGGVGNDFFREGAASNGADRIQGDAGKDYVFYNARTAKVTVRIDGVANDGATGEGDEVGATNEVVYGGSAGDSLQGGNADEELRGGGGGDTLRGGGGKDTIIGGPGTDFLFGDAGMDALDLVDGVNGNDTGNGGTETDTATKDPGDTVTNVP